MKNLFKRIFYRVLYWLLKAMIAVRYRVEVKGLKELREKKWPNPGGVLFLPNHPAEMDPIMLMLALWYGYQPKPLVIEYFYHQKGIRFFMDLVRAIPLPNMDTSNQWKARQVEKLKTLVFERLQKNDNFLIYPSGKLKQGPDERIGGASFIHDLLSIKPQINIALVRTTGLWGSMFSRALTGNTPDLTKTYLRGMFIALKNFFFFVPKRKVTIEVEAAPDDFPYQASRLELNRYLEQWYNRYPEPGPEPLKLISYSCFKEVLPQVTATPKEETVNEAAHPIPQDVEATIKGYISKLSRYAEKDIHPGLHLSNDLGLDSLDVAQIYIFLEERFNQTGIIPGQLQTVQDVYQAAAGLKKQPEQEQVKKKRPKMPREAFRPEPKYPKGSTIQEVFLRTCDRYGSHAACLDQLTGLLSFRKLKRSALVLALHFQRYPDERLGVLLPSSNAAFLVILAILLAKKVPVMLNWTVGSKALEHAATVTELKHVISSYRFLSRIDNGDIGKVDDLLVLLEEMRRTISFKDKLKGLFLSFLSTNSLLKSLHLSSVKETEHAVIIFTSGTETLPKGVPLTHYNLLSNQRSALPLVHLKAEDIIYSVLPPFHSFGLSVTGLMPLLCGLRVCYAPDPTDSRGLANDIFNWKPTLFCCAPSFIKALFQVAKKEDLESVQLFVSGAEKAPQELFDFVAKLGKEKKLIEGYGISECSPIVTIDRPEEPHRGVGKPIPGVELCVINPDSNELLPLGQEGEICIHGPNVFSGYLGYTASPFIMLQEKNWYRSGDRGYIEADGTLNITGRLKRFVKIGGEMVSLGGLEEELLRYAKERNWVPADQKGPSLAVTAIGRESDKPQIVVITTFDVSKEDLNNIIKESGWGRIVKISQTFKIKEIPLTGTGKTNYRVLDETIKYL